ncbi:hypothetical protein ACFQ5N_08420 [Lutibacter holmesii]|uniref:NAD glycohydrolase translocation F5/8 type C domain-containing protein n=1 Tax=Lutibacter holmesii TaxID=1137985 RepID=A0ABW3WRH2_9FLAO
MNKNLILILIFFTTNIFSQSIKTISAIQGKDSDYFEYEDYDENQNPIGKLEFLKGCSWYCGGSVTEIIVSSELKEQNGIHYSPKNAHDFDKNTAWIEGKPDYGIGEFIEYRFDFKNYNGGLGINKILLTNGYKKDKTNWKNNSRVKQLKMYINDKPYSIINLLDSFEIQTIEIDKIMFPSNKMTKLRFEILDIYKEDKFKDTAISLLMFEGIGVH